MDRDINIFPVCRFQSPGLIASQCVHCTFTPIQALELDLADFIELHMRVIVSLAYVGCSGPEGPDERLEVEALLALL